MPEKGKHIRGGNPHPFRGTSWHGKGTGTDAENVRDATLLQRQLLFRFHRSRNPRASF